MSIEQYGNDVLLKDGDLIASANGDLFTSKDYEFSNQATAKFEGYYNIYFSLTDRIISVKGDNIFHKTYGSDVYNYLSSPNSANLKNALQQTIADCLIQDDRVKSVQSVVVEQKGNVASVKVNLLLVGTSQASEFVFPNFVIE